MIRFSFLIIQFIGERERENFNVFSKVFRIEEKLENTLCTYNLKLLNAFLRCLESILN